MTKITHVHGRQILDSRGNPTVEVDVYLEDGSQGRMAVPSGASTGSREAHELRDGGKAFGGNGVLKAVEHVNTEIQNVVVGMDAYEQLQVDRKIVQLDGTKDKSRLGANAILGVSLAVAKAEANARQEFLFEYIGGLLDESVVPSLPMPMCNLINGGKHAAGSTDIQEFMVLPIGAEDFSHAVQMVAEIFQSLKGILRLKGYATTVGDEGGFAPRVKKGNKEALDLLSTAVEKAGYILGRDVGFAIDVASNEIYKDGTYTLKSENKKYDTQGMLDFYGSLIKEFPLLSIEDGLFEDDWKGWQEMNTRLGKEIQIVGDDFLVTNVTYLKKAIEQSSANSILIKANQVGTLTETIEAVEMAKKVGWKTIVSHRSGETEDTTIAHLAVGLASGQIKTGSMSRSDRIAKYNELLRIEELMGNEAILEKWK